MSARSRTPERFSFANLDEVLPLPDLVSVQRDSFDWFLSHGLAETFADISPIEDFTGQLRLELEFDPDDPDLRPPPKFTIDECKAKDMTYAGADLRARPVHERLDGRDQRADRLHGRLPDDDAEGAPSSSTGPSESSSPSSSARPGVIFQPGRDAKTIVTGTIHPYRGEWIEFDVEAKPNRDITAGTRVARKRRLSLFVLLRALGYEDEGFLERFVRHFDFLSGQWEKEREHRPDARGRAPRDLQARPPR